MSDRGMTLSMVVRLIDRATKPLAKINRGMHELTAGPRRVQQSLRLLGAEAGLNKVGAAAGRLGKAIGPVAQEATRLGTKLAAIGGVGGFLFKRGFLDTAADFEKFLAVLETSEGSADKARRAFDWVNRFAVQTPFQLAEVTGAFVNLRNLGLDPTSGLLKTLGDTAAAMTVPLDQAVQAMADAVTGENERLKAFGVTTQTKGNTVRFNYSIDGKELHKDAQRGNRAMIQSTLEAIWNEKYGGAMEKMKGLWGFMINNLADQWTRFAMMVMDSGVFKFLKEKLKGVLDWADALAESGKMQLIAVLAGPLLLAIGSLTLALKGLGIALLTTPVGWFLAAVAAIVGAAALIYDNWEPIAGFFSDLWAGIQETFAAALAWITDKAESIARLARGVVDALPFLKADDLGFGGLAGSPEGAYVPAPVRSAYARRGEGRERAGLGRGEVHVRFDNAPAGMRVERVKADGAEFDLDVDAGLSMVGP